MQFYHQKWIERADLQNNPNTFFLFGDNVKRVGMGGQAKSMRGEANAIGIATKWTPSNNVGEFFSDEDYSETTRIIAQDFRKVFTVRDNGFSIVIPADGLGTGLSELPQRAPKTNEFVLWMLDLLVCGRQPAWKTLINGARNAD